MFKNQKITFYILLALLIISVIVNIYLVYQLSSPTPPSNFSLY